MSDQHALLPSQQIDASALRVAVITPTGPENLETFINAHLERLSYRCSHLYGPVGDLTWEGLPLSKRVRPSHGRSIERAFSSMQRFVPSRLRTRLPKKGRDQLADFLNDERIDVVLAEYGTVAAEVMPACAEAKIPLVAHFHGFDATRSWVLERYATDYPAMFEYASKVIVVSRAMRLQLLSLGCPDDKLVLSHYGPNPAYLQVEPDYASRQLLAVGRLTEKKAPYLTLAAFAKAITRCPGIKLTMIGDGELRAVCEDLVKALDIEDHVTLLGRGSPSVIQAQMARSFAFVQHSIVASDGDMEGTPVAILEAGAAGLAVVSTRHAGIPEVVIDGVTGLLVEEKDVNAMSEAIVSLAINRDLAQALGANARQHVSEHFSIEAHIRTISNALESSVTLRR
jgi:glycosyltransferase involved in cell wall biosynthesis